MREAVPVHTAIDNLENGHSRNALIAIQKYLDEIEVKEGKEVVQQHWYRIWIGYTAYAVIGDFHPDLKAKFAAEASATPRDRFKQLIAKKAKIAMHQHAANLLHGKSLNHRTGLMIRRASRQLWSRRTGSWLETPRRACS